MDIARKIINSQTIDELVTLENLYVLSDYEQGLVFERKAEITSRLAEWATVLKMNIKVYRPTSI